MPLVLLDPCAREFQIRLTAHLCICVLLIVVAMCPSDPAVFYYTHLPPVLLYEPVALRCGADSIWSGDTPHPSCCGCSCHAFSGSCGRKYGCAFNSSESWISIRKKRHNSASNLRVTGQYDSISSDQSRTTQKDFCLIVIIDEDKTTIYIFKISNK